MINREDSLQLGILIAIAVLCVNLFISLLTLCYLWGHVYEVAS